MLFKLVLFVSILLVLANFWRVDYDSQEGCDSVAYVFIGAIGTVVSVAYLFGGGIQ